MSPAVPRSKHAPDTTTAVGATPVVQTAHACGQGHDFHDVQVAMPGWGWCWECSRCGVFIKRPVIGQERPAGRPINARTAPSHADGGIAPVAGTDGLPDPLVLASVIDLLVAHLVITGNRAACSAIHHDLDRLGARYPTLARMLDHLLVEQSRMDLWRAYHRVEATVAMWEK